MSELDNKLKLFRFFETVQNLANNNIALLQDLKNNRKNTTARNEFVNSYLLNLQNILTNFKANMSKFSLMFNTPLNHHTTTFKLNYENSKKVLKESNDLSSHTFYNNCVLDFKNIKNTLNSISVQVERDINLNKNTIVSENRFSKS